MCSPRLRLGLQSYITRALPPVKKWLFVLRGFHYFNLRRRALDHAPTEWKLDCKRRAFARLALHIHRTAVRTHDPCDKAEPQAKTLFGRSLLAGASHPIEPVEDV